MNSRAAVAGGVCYGVNENLKRTAKVHLQKGVREFLNRSCGSRVLQVPPEHEKQRVLARLLHSEGLECSA
jgi:hypothetical protein